MEEFLDQVDPIKFERAVFCVLHQEDTHPEVRHHHKILGFPFMQYSCPRETQLVMSLLTALLSRLDEASIGPSFRWTLMDKVHLYFFTISPLVPALHGFLDSIHLGHQFS